MPCENGLLCLRRATENPAHRYTEVVGIPVYGEHFDWRTGLIEVSVTGIEIVPNLYTRCCSGFLLGCTPHGQPQTVLACTRSSPQWRI